jgi:hypothetical protein
MTQKQPEKYIGETEKNLARLRQGELEEWITTAEAVKISGYHPQRIRELLREGKVAGRKFGTIWQVKPESLLAYLEKMDEKGERRGPKPKEK